MKVVVIGAGHAGVAFVDAMRRNGFAGELTMIDRLAGLPLERPPLSKAFLLAEEGEEDGFALRAQHLHASSFPLPYSHFRNATHSFVTSTV